MPDRPDEEIHCSIDDEHLEISREAHYQEMLVTVAAKQTSGARWEVLDIEFADETQE